MELGQRFYDETLRSQLEPGQIGQFVAIEPESGRYFLGDTGTAALLEAYTAMPGCRFHLVRVGYGADTVSGASIRSTKPNPCHTLHRCCH